MIKIRLAQDKDFAEIARLHRQTIKAVNSKDYPEKMIKVWSAKTSAQSFRNCADKCKRWVATFNEQIVGFCDHNFTCELWGLYVHKNFLGQGIGEKLLRVAEKSMIKSKCKKITVKSTITAKNFYLKHGYKLIKKDFHQIEDQKLPIFILEKEI